MIQDTLDGERIGDESNRPVAYYNLLFFIDNFNFSVFYTKISASSTNLIFLLLYFCCYCAFYCQNILTLMDIVPQGASQPVFWQYFPMPITYPAIR